MRKLLVLPLFLVSLSACDKDKNKQYSEWYVDGQKYSSNDVDVVIGKAETRIGSNGADRFGIGFNFGSFTGGGTLPTQGTYYIQHTINQHPDSAGIGIYANGKFYILEPNTSAAITAHNNNGKAQYRLSETWFVEYYNHTDSVVIHGTFNEP